MEIIYFKATINNNEVYVETTTELIGLLFDHFLDNGYEIEKMKKEQYYNYLKDGRIVYDARKREVVDEFIEINNKAKQIKYGG